MSAGSGLYHSEYNASKKDSVNFLQIWIFPKERDITPRYEQKTFNADTRKNKFQTVVSPEKNNGALWINQNAYFSLGSMDKNISIKYEIKLGGNGLYAFVLSGSVEIAGENLSKRDAIGLEELESVDIKALENSEILLIEVPVKIQ